MNYKTLLSAMWIVVLLLGFASPAQAGGIIKPSNKVSNR